MYRYWICYKKKGSLRFISHLDLLRTVQRGIRRAGLPVAFSEGFNPHPKISFAAPLPVGVEGCNEYLDLELRDKPESMPGLVKAVNSCLPEGLEFIRAVEVSPEAPSLMAKVESADYRAVCRAPRGWGQQELENRLEEFLQQKEITVQRSTKKGIKEKDIRPGIIKLTGTIKENSLFLYLKLKTGSRENVKTGEVLRELEAYLPVQAKDFRVTRTALYGKGDVPILQEKKDP